VKVDKRLTPARPTIHLAIALKVDKLLKVGNPSKANKSRKQGKPRVAHLSQVSNPLRVGKPNQAGNLLKLDNPPIKQDKHLLVKNPTRGNIRHVLVINHTVLNYKTLELRLNKSRNLVNYLQKHSRPLVPIKWDECHLKR
jgi:hypothetical protein